MPRREEQKGLRGDDRKGLPVTLSVTGAEDTGLYCSHLQLSENSFLRPFLGKAETFFLKFHCRKEFREGPVQSWVWILFIVIFIFIYNLFIYL